jgi:Ni,Fe-hydrogenase I cytochrome b subunit
MKQWHWIVLIALTALTVVGQFIEHHYWWEAVPGFFAVFGFVGCLLIIFIAKSLGGLMVSQKPDYYDKFKKHEEAKTDAH